MSIKSWLKDHTTIFDPAISIRYRNYEFPEWDNTPDGDHVFNLAGLLNDMENDRKKNQELMDILSKRITNAFDLIRAEIEEHEARFHAKKGKK